MKFHGLVSLTVFGLSSVVLAQDQLLPVPAQPSPGVRSPAARTGEMPRREPGMIDADPAESIEAELQQFRNELREFQELREDVSRSTRETGIDSDRVSLQQRKDLVDLLTRITKNGVLRKSPASRQTPAPEPMEVDPPYPSDPVTPAPVQPSFEIPDDVTDPFSLGKVLFRSGDYVSAELAFRKVEVTLENAPTLNYLIATCLRRQSKLQSAMEVYKAVADSDQDPVLQKLAEWQIGNIRYQRECEAQLEKMRIEREKRLGPVKSPQAKAEKLNRARR